MSGGNDFYFFFSLVDYESEGACGVFELHGMEWALDTAAGKVARNNDVMLLDFLNLVYTLFKRGCDGFLKCRIGFFEASFHVCDLDMDGIMTVFPLISR